MKVLIITCSHRTKNVSYSISIKLVRLIRHLKQDVKVDVMELAKMNLRSCCGTSQCTEMEDVKCVYGDEDDFNYIFKQMLESDCVLFIVPKYAPYPSKLLQLYERLVAVGWWGYVNKTRIEKFPLYQKAVGLICFASSPVTTESTFTPLMESFKEIGFSLLSFYKEEHGMFINRANDNTDEMLQKVAEVVVSKLEERGGTAWN